MSLILTQSIESAVQLHRLPKSIVDIYVMVLQADGGELAAAITCASMALANAGIEMYDLVAGCTVCSSDNSNNSNNSKGGNSNSNSNSNSVKKEEIHETILLDPTKDEIDNGLGAMTVAIMSSNNEVTQWCQQGCFDSESMMDTISLCTDGCKTIHAMMKNRLINHTKSVSTDSTV